ncbi:hypothetical protein McanMca71_004696 [Microsporum canis]|uniref:Defect at low temperature protein 1 n=1 Tax=Arthroderma otae (strain ATCC MYA-4605 / CBS 113480) TaxID=554155 RepID=C5FUE3_ARTOC|nr:sucrase/ferredoxin domain-containing protein [Microsporum canis CBS 113480]EEQ33527.1 sucrase/ferredoxin domain-containing protein [Microsporum canis CBS 113480]
MSFYRYIFRIVSATLFSFLSIILFALTLLSPADIIYQSHRNHRLGNIFAISGVYIITLLLAILIYASRLFTNRSVLAGIPKPWIPVEKADVSKRVRRLVVGGLLRSSVIAQQSRPRDVSQDDTGHLDPSLLIPKDQKPPWGSISHAGWTAPHCPDLPNQEFEAVIKELPHLIEAKAVSLAPTDPRPMSRLDHQASRSRGDERVHEVPDERVVEILQRPPNMCLRDYLNHLNRLSLIDPPHLIQDFIRLYECSRFSGRPLEECEFREMMGLFAEILRSMRGINPVILSELQSTGSSDGAGSIGGRSSYYGGGPVFSNSDPSFVSVAENKGDIPARLRYHPSIYSASDKSSFRLGASDTHSIRTRRTPSTRSLRLMPSNVSINSGESVIRRTVSHV